MYHIKLYEGIKVTVDEWVDTLEGKWQELVSEHMAGGTRMSGAFLLVCPRFDKTYIIELL